VKQLVRHLFLGHTLVDSILEAIKARGDSSPAAPFSSSAREARGCESWQWCGPADE
jgi:hypothetical protein